MENLFSAIEKAVDDENWYAALSLSMMLPDICGRFAYPKMSADKSRYVKWFDDNLLATYTARIGANRDIHVFLNGGDCYALRCALLHNGTDDITEQRARVLLERFMFIPPMPGIYVHKNQFNNTTLQLQVDKFSQEFVTAGRKWWGQLSEEERRAADRMAI
jgi:hypothetical protein